MRVVVAAPQRAARARSRAGLAIGLGAFGLLTGFVLLHSGARAEDLCERERFVRVGSLSIWPPGARCSFGEPAVEETLVNPWFELAANSIVIVVIATVAATADR